MAQSFQTPLQLWEVSYAASYIFVFSRLLAWEPLRQGDLMAA